MLRTALAEQDISAYLFMTHEWAFWDEKLKTHIYPMDWHWKPYMKSSSYGFHPLSGLLFIVIAPPEQGSIIDDIPEFNLYHHTPVDKIEDFRAGPNHIGVFRVAAGEENNLEDIKIKLDF